MIELDTLNLIVERNGPRVKISLLYLPLVDSDTSVADNFSTDPGDTKDKDNGCGTVLQCKLTLNSLLRISCMVDSLVVHCLQ